MTALIGGVIAVVLGLIGIIGWWSEFIDLLQGAVPILLLLGGALAVYLGSEELKDKRRAELEAAQAPFAPSTAGGDDEVEKYKSEVAELKAKLEAMENSEAEPSEEEEKTE